MATRPKLNRLIASQLPEFIREDYPTFVAFLEAYYEWMCNEKCDLYSIRDIDTTLDNFIEYFKNELAVNAFTPPAGIERMRHDLAHSKEYHLAKGSEQAYKFLFRLMFGKNVTVQYPGQQVLRASDGKWIQDVSVFAKVNAGDPNSVVGRLVDVVTPNRIIRIVCLGCQEVELEIEKIKQISPDTYEFFIDRRFFGDVAVGDRLRYGGIFDATILSTTANIKVQQKGKDFKVGQLYDIKNGQGAGSVLKIKNVDSNGGILSAEFVKYGIGYTTNFTATLLAAAGGQTTTGTGQTALNVQTINSGVTSIILSNGGSGYTSTPTVALSGGGYTNAATIGSVTIVGGVITQITISNPGVGYTAVPGVIITGGGGTGASATASIGTASNYSVFEVTEGFAEQGVINKSDYVSDTSTIWIPSTTYTVGTELFWDGKVYNVTVAGTTGSTPPTHSSGASSNGTATLTYSRIYGAAFDGSYAGDILREFFYDSKEQVVDPDAPAIVAVELGPLTKYPGYYKNNDGFLDDAIFIQDSKFYQSFSYLLKIDETLDKYRSAVKSLTHPAGLALFGEYDIRNEFDVGITLESMVKILVRNLQDEFYPTDAISFKDFGKSLSTSSTGFTEVWTHLTGKSLGSQYLNDGTTLENTSFTLNDTVSAKDFGKSLSTDTEGFTEVETFSMQKPLDDSFELPEFLETKVFDIEKPLEDGVVATESNTFSMAKPLNDTISEPTDAISAIDTEKPLETSTVGFSEINTFSMQKPLEDSFELPEFLETKVFDIEKPLTDDQSVSDVFVQTVIKPLNDTLDPQDDEIASFDVEKPLSDETTISDDDVIGFGKVLNSTLDPQQDIITNIDVEKSLADTAVISENIALNSDKYMSVDTFALSDDGGYIVFDPYETGGYFAEVYVGARITF